MHACNHGLVLCKRPQLHVKTRCFCGEISRRKGRVASCQVSSLLDAGLPAPMDITLLLKMLSCDLPLQTSGKYRNDGCYRRSERPR